MNKLALFLVACLAALTALAADVPYLSGRVVDNAEILDAETKRKLTEQLKAHEAETANQIAVLTVPSLEGESVESYAEQVFNTWKLGKKDKDNGVLVLVAPNERRMRIEVGYGLEGSLTDVAASRIIRNVMTPRFKEGNYNAGVEAGVKAIVGLVDGAEVPASEPHPVVEKRHDAFFEGPDLSITERFFAGGSHSFRGTRNDRLGPINLDSDNPEGEPEGGNILLLLNLEATVPSLLLPVENLYYTFFADVGNVFGKSSDLNLKKMERALGFGLKYRTPLGPIRLDFAFNLRKAAEQNFLVQIGIGNVY